MNPCLAAAPAADLLDVFNAYDGTVIFRGLTVGLNGQPPVLGRVGWVFTGFGACFTLWGFVLRTQSAGAEAKMEEIARTWIVIALLIAGPFLMRVAMQGADQLYGSTVGGPANLTTACVKAAYAMPELTELFDVLRKASPPSQGGSGAERQALLSGANDGSVLGYLEAFGVALWDTGADYASDARQTWGGMVRLAGMATGFGSAMLKCLLILLTVGPLYLLLLASAAVIWFMGQLRFFLAVSGTMMLPLFVGMFSLPSGHPNRQAAQAYVMNLVSLALWPVAWSIGHTATIALYDALISLIAGTSRVPDMVSYLQWSSVTSQGVTDAQVQAGAAALGNWFMGNVTALLSILVGGVGFAAWVMSVSILGPVFLHKMLSAGALYVTQAAGSAARQSAVAGRFALSTAHAHGLGSSFLSGAAVPAGERLASSQAVLATAFQSGPWAGAEGGGAASMAGAARSIDVSDGNEPSRM